MSNILVRDAFKKTIPLLAARVAAVSVDTLRRKMDRYFGPQIPLDGSSD